MAVTHKIVFWAKLLNHSKNKGLVAKLLFKVVKATSPSLFYQNFGICFV